MLSRFRFLPGLVVALSATSGCYLMLDTDELDSKSAGVQAPTDVESGDAKVASLSGQQRRASVQRWSRLADVGYTGILRRLA